MHIPPPSIEYPENGSSARIRISFTSHSETPEVPSTAFFYRLKPELPDGDPLRIEHGPWPSYADAKEYCWAIAKELDEG